MVKRSGTRTTEYMERITRLVSLKMYEYGRREAVAVI